jgi:hypothetical protein
LHGRAGRCAMKSIRTRVLFAYHFLTLLGVTYHNVAREDELPMYRQVEKKASHVRLVIIL